MIYTRFHTESAVLLRRIKNQNIEAENQKLMVETLGPLQGKQEVFKEGTTFKSARYWSFCELHLPAGLLELAGRLRLFYYRGLISSIYDCPYSIRKEYLDFPYLYKNGHPF